MAQKARASACLLLALCGAKVAWPLHVASTAQRRGWATWSARPAQGSQIAVTELPPVGRVGADPADGGGGHEDQGPASVLEVFSHLPPDTARLRVHALDAIGGAVKCERARHSPWSVRTTQVFRLPGESLERRIGVAWNSCREFADWRHGTRHHSTKG